MPTALAPTAENLLRRPYGGVSPFAPAGITDATRQGWATQLGGAGAQYAPAQAYAKQMGQFAPAATRDFTNRFNSGQFGGDFNPWNPHLLQAISSANQQMGRDFRQQTMPSLNARMMQAGPGALGGSRAGVAEGLAKQGLADAMQRNTTQMAHQGYQAGITEMGNAQGRNNQMYQFGMDYLPQLYRQSYQAGLAPGQTQQQMGGMLAGMGGQQQQQNQQLMNWYNQQYNDAQQYPDQRFTNWTNQMGPVLKPGQQASVNQMGYQPAQSPYAGAVGGALGGYGVYNAYQQTQQPTNPYTGGPQGSYDPRLSTGTGGYPR